MIKIFLTIVGILLLLSAVGWLGLLVKPKGFSPLPEPSEVSFVPMPDDLPQPVKRFYKGIYNDTLPVITSFVVSGRARLRIKGVYFHARYRFSHEAGKAYRHDIDVTWFGIPVMRVKEYYTQGQGRLELPFGVEEGPRINQAANLGLWAETLWAPAIYITDARVQWMPIDGQTAAMVVPYCDDNQRFIARFDPASGMLHFLESMRYKGAASDDKTLWINEVVEWREVSGHLIPMVSTATWIDEGMPWAIFNVEDVRYNVNFEVNNG